MNGQQPPPEAMQEAVNRADEVIEVDASRDGVKGKFDDPTALEMVALVLVLAGVLIALGMWLRRKEGR